MCIYQINKACYIIYIAEIVRISQSWTYAKAVHVTFFLGGEHFQLLLCIVVRWISSSHFGNDDNGIPALDIVQPKKV